METFDLAVVGAGIVGLAHALAAARRGLRVVVLERDARATMASVRNFGFVTVTGQAGGETRRRALRSREVWAEVAPQAGIAIHQRGAVVVARREEARAVLQEFVAGPMGEGCTWWDAKEAARRIPGLAPGALGALASPHELRVEPREALPKLAAWLESTQRVFFRWGCGAAWVRPGLVGFADGEVEADAIVVAPGAAVAHFAPGLAHAVRLRQCKLQMLRLAPPSPAYRLPGALMADLSLVRYEGFAMQPSAPALAARLQRERPAMLEHGVHLIVAQAADGSLVVGDSHHEHPNADPFASEAVDELLLESLREVLDLPRVEVVERWIGHYPVADVKPLLRGSLASRVVLASVTSGTGMSTAFAIGEETIADLFR